MQNGKQGVLKAKPSISGKLSLPNARSDDYERLKNLPRINDVTVIGNKSFDEYGLEECSNIDIDTLFKNIF